MKPIAAMSLPRGKFLLYQADAMRNLVRGLMSVARLDGSPRATQAFNEFLIEEGLRPNNDKDVLAWLQNHPGDTIGAFIFLTDEGKFKFLLSSGTQAELQQIGLNYGQAQANDSQGSAS